MQEPPSRKNTTSHRHVLYPAAPAGYSDPTQTQLSSPAPENRSTNVGKATSKAGAYGGSELGSIVGGAVGPPVIGGIIGNLVGEKVGEKAIRETGLDEVAAKTGDKLSKVVGRDNVEKLGEITLTAFGYSDTEECVCCPCLPASQILLFLTVPFYFFNIYKLGLGVSYESGCTALVTNETSNRLQTVNPSNASANSTGSVYPCEFGFEYLQVSGAVWMALLPFWICGLFGNCWRQCCCCCCDPIVLCSTVADLLKKCCCECGKIKVCEILWLVHCSFHIVWSIMAMVWWLGLGRENKLFEETIKVESWTVPQYFINTVIASIVLDFILAGSEIFHRIRIKFRTNSVGEDAETMNVTTQLVSKDQPTVHQSSDRWSTTN